MGSTDVHAAVRRGIARAGRGIYGVACSGGADSIALLDATIEVAGGGNVVAIAIDHQLTPGSGAVCDAVAAFARGRGATCEIRQVVVAKRASIEAAARDARYAAFEAIADELGLVAIFVGHTARDQAETVLLRIIRGTGPAGLVGIPYARGRFVRPLLGIERGVIDAYVAARRLPVADDPMNDDARLARVRVRCDLMPRLARENPQIEAALVRLATSAGEWLVAIDATAATLANAAVADAATLAEPAGSARAAALKTTTWLHHSAAVRKRAIATILERIGTDYEAAHIEAIDALLVSPQRGERSLDISGARVTRSYDQLSIVPTGRDPVPEVRTTIDVPAGYRRRTPMPGDRMKPARLKGRSRKLSDLFIDAKIPRNLRASAAVIYRESDGIVVFVEHLGPSIDAPADLPI